MKLQFCSFISCGSVFGFEVRESKEVGLSPYDVSLSLDKGRKRRDAVANKIVCLAHQEKI